MRTEQQVRRDLQDAEACLERLDERRSRLVGHLDNLREELLDLVGAHDRRPVAVR